MNIQATSKGSVQTARMRRLGIFKRLAKALTKLRICVDWSEHLMVAHTTLLEFSYRSSIIGFTQHTILSPYVPESSPGAFDAEADV